MTKHGLKDLDTKFIKEYPFSYIIYKKANEDAMAVLTNFDRSCTDEHIKIPSFINDIPVKVIGEEVFAGTLIKSVDFPKHLITIRKRAFYDCYKLKEVDIPNSVKFIHQNVFSFCSGLENVKWSKQSNVIRESTFCDCVRLKNITDIDNVEVIEEGAFRGCSSIKSFKVPEKCLSIEKDAFRDCLNLKYVYISSSLLSIGKNVFMDSELVKLNCNKNKKIREWAIGNNIKLYTSELTKFFDDINKDSKKEEVSRCND